MRSRPINESYIVEKGFRTYEMRINNTKNDIKI